MPWWLSQVEFSQLSGAIKSYFKAQFLKFTCILCVARLLFWRETARITNCSSTSSWYLGSWSLGFLTPYLNHHIGYSYKKLLSAFWKLIIFPLLYTLLWVFYFLQSTQ
jgi:hypothetical protein